MKKIKNLKVYKKALIVLGPLAVVGTTLVYPTCKEYMKINSVKKVEISVSDEYKVLGYDSDLKPIIIKYRKKLTEDTKISYIVPEGYKLEYMNGKYVGVNGNETIEPKKVCEEGLIATYHDGEYIQLYNRGIVDSSEIDIKYSAPNGYKVEENNGVYYAVKVKTKRK